jgi:predicted transcriptional regulator
MTVNEFVKAIRLSEAKKLLESGVYNVAEVATIIDLTIVSISEKSSKKTQTKSKSKYPDKCKIVRSLI